jgi:hypothetical protein
MNLIKIITILFSILLLNSFVYADVSTFSGGADAVIFPVVGLIIAATVLLGIIVFVVKVIKKIKASIRK